MQKSKILLAGLPIFAINFLDTILVAGAWKKFGKGVETSVNNPAFRLILKVTAPISQLWPQL